MRALRRLARPAVATTAAVLLLAGCGDDDDNGGDASSSSSSSSSASSSSSSSSSEESGGSGGDDELAAFCSDAQEFITEAAEVGSISDPSQFLPQLEEAITAFDDTTPPDEIASDWEVLGDALRSLGDTANSVDLSTPEGAQQLTEAATEFQEVFTGEAGQAVDEFGSANCT